MNTEEEYDGFHFLPDPEDDDSFVFQFFRLSKIEDNTDSTDVLGKTTVGDLYNVMLMREKDGIVEVTDEFQAIFADPTVYAEGLIGSDHYGTFVKNTQHAKTWWEAYVSATKKTIEKFNTTGIISEE